MFKPVLCRLPARGINIGIEYCYEILKQREELKSIMDTAWILEELKAKALADKKLRSELLKTRSEKDPLKSFCETAVRYGFSISPWDLISAGEEAYAARRRSTNGGGENSPLLEWSDDYYELLMAELEMKD